MADLKRHFENDSSATRALGDLMEIRVWKVWHCWCNFYSMFYIEDLMMQHILREHVRGAITSLEEFQFFSRENNSTELESVYKIYISSEKWRPVDVAAAVKMMKDLSRNAQGQDISKVFMNQDEWPYCNDSKREEIINKIQERLREFLNIGWFDSSRISVFMDLIMDMMKEINADTFKPDMIFDILSEEQEQDNEIILVIRNQIDEMTEKVCYRQIYEHVKFSKLFDVKFNVLCEILYMLALIAWSPLHTLSTQSAYSCTMLT